MVAVRRLWGLLLPVTAELLPSSSSLEVMTKVHCKKKVSRFKAVTFNILKCFFKPK